MQTRKLGYSELELTKIGLGTWAIGGGGNPIGWGPQDDEDSIATIRQAIELGLNWIDTAPAYGLGHSEEVVGRAINGYRDKVLIATKCGILWKTDENGKTTFPRDLKADSLTRQVEDSLRRLKVDTIDLLQIHWPPVPDTDLEEGWTAILNLIEAGKVRYAGVSNFSISQMERLLKIHPIASLQPPYSILNREIERELLPYCASKNIGVVAYSPLERGLLTGKITKERVAQMPADDSRQKTPPFQEPQLTANLNLVESLKSVALDKGVTLSQLAIAWALRRPEVTSVIVGARHPHQIEETALAGNVELTPEEIQTIDSLIEKREKALVATEAR